MGALGGGQYVIEEVVVVVEVEAVYLEPNTGDMDRVAMGRESPVGGVDVPAHGFGAFDDLILVGWNLLDITLGEARVEHLGECLRRPINAVGTELVADDFVDGVAHIGDIGGTEPGEAAG